MLDAKTRAFYRHILSELRHEGIPFAIGGAYGLRFHTGIVRQTKDLDLFLRRQDLERALNLLSAAGYRTEVTHSHWLGKVYAGHDFIDIIFSSGNGVAVVDDALFEHATKGLLLGVPVLWCPVEEMIWSKAYVMERERYDGADVAHLFHVCGTRIDWPRLLARFGSHWRLLFAHLVLFGFIYPADQHSIPAWVQLELMQRLQSEIHAAQRGDAVCAGTLLSREQFLIDVEDWGYVDGRLAHGAMSESEIAHWTSAIEHPRQSVEPRSTPRTARVPIRRTTRD
ncbi:MAG: nucleotidyltransferase [Myxococcales bacterium]